MRSNGGYLYILGGECDAFDYDFSSAGQTGNGENTIYEMQWIVLTVKLPSPCRPVLIDEIEVRLNMYCIKIFFATKERETHSSFKQVS
jgi:hypothetical protein